MSPNHPHDDGEDGSNNDLPENAQGRAVGHASDDGDNVISTLDTGAEVQFTTERETAVADRAEILEGGWVKLIYKSAYTKELHPPHTIDCISAHTSDEEENAEWW